MSWTTARTTANPRGLATDRTEDIGPLRGGRLNHEAANLLTNVESRDAFSRRSPTGAMAQFPQIEVGPADAAAAENPEVLKGMNADTDRVVQMLGRNQSTELFDALVDRDRTQAAEFAVDNTEVQTYALHEAGDEAFRQDVRLRLSGTPAA